MKINMNGRVHVNLTDHGYSVLMAYAAETAAKCKMSEASVLRSISGYNPETPKSLNIPLWEILHIFGDAHFMGCSTCFEDNCMSINTANKVGVLEKHNTELMSGLDKAIDVLNHAVCYGSHYHVEVKDLDDLIVLQRRIKAEVENAR